MIATRASLTLRSGLLLSALLSLPLGQAVAQQAAVTLPYSAPASGYATLGATLAIDAKAERASLEDATVEVSWGRDEVVSLPLDLTAWEQEGQVLIDVPLGEAVASGQVTIELVGTNAAWEVVDQGVDFAETPGTAGVWLESATREAASGKAKFVLRSTRPIGELPSANAFALFGGESLPHMVVRPLDAYRWQVETTGSVSAEGALQLVFNGGGQDAYGLAHTTQRFFLRGLEAEPEAPARAGALASGPIAAAEVTIPLPLAESPVGSGIFSAFATGSFNSGGGQTNAYNYQIELEGGDQLSVYTNSTLATPPVHRLQLYGPTGTLLIGSSNGSPDPIQQYAITTPGTYTVRYWTDGSTDFEIRIDVGRGESLESEPNGELGQANFLRFNAIAGGSQAQIAGALADLERNSWFVGSNDVNGDFYRLGAINAGNSIDITYALPDDSTLEVGDLELVLYRAGQATPLAITSTGSGLSHTASANDLYYLQVGINDNLDGTSLVFDGGTDRVDLPPEAMHGRTAMTVEFWMRGTPSNRALISTAHASQNNEWLVWIVNATTMDVYDHGSYRRFTVPTIDEATWRHYAIVRNPTAGTVGIFVDGVSVGSQAATLNPLNSQGFVLGQDQDSVNGGYDSNQAFLGSLDDLRIWSVVRTPTEIADHQKVILDGDEPGLVAYWRFNEGTGTAIADETANDYDGTLNGVVFQGDVNAAGFNPAKLGMLARYVATATISDSIAPTVVGTSLPNPNNSEYYVSFTVDFSEDMAPLTVANSANYSLASAGPDGFRGTGDDEVYTLAVMPYANGTRVTFDLPDGPLQPGDYRFTAGIGLTDRAANALVPYTLDFTLDPLGDFIVENRSNNTRATATPLALMIDATHDGTFTIANTFGAGNFTGLEQVDLNGDGNLDLLALDTATDVVTAYLHNGAGGYTMGETYPLTDEAYYSAVADFNGDGRLDLAVTLLDDDQIRVFFNQGDGTLLPVGTTNVGDGPYEIVAGDFNGDGDADLAVANYYGDSLTILLNDGNGSFTATTIDAGANTEPYGLAVGDFNEDSRLDLAYTEHAGNRIGLLLGQGDGTFASATYLALNPTEQSPQGVRAADLDGDNHLDLVVVFDRNWNASQGSIYFGAGDGTFVDEYRFDAGTYSKQLKLLDIDGDGLLDVTVSTPYEFRYLLGTGRRESPLAGATVMDTLDSMDGVAVDDVTDNGRNDLILAGNSSDNFTLLTGNPTVAPLADAGIPGLRQALGRGNIRNTTDVDYFSFSVDAGDKLSLVVDSMREGTQTMGLAYLIYPLTGSTSLNATYGSYTTGRAVSNPLTLAAPGTYYVVVQRNWDYWDEYRFRLSLASSDFQLESEPNDNINQADPLSLQIEGGALQGKMLAQANEDDTSGDYFSIGNYGEGATITLTFQNTEDSNLTPQLWILTSDNVVRSGGAQGQTTISYTVTEATEGAYFVRMRGVDGTRDFWGEYVLSVEVSDATPIQITSDTLPGEGSTVSTMINGLSLTVTEDLDPDSANNVAYYDLRSSGADGVFNTADDEVYTFDRPTYVSGRTLTLSFPDGPVQPGDIRFSIPAGSLRDRFGNTLEAPYVRTFRIEGLPPFVTESRSNNTFATADSISVTPSDDHSGSFTNLPPVATLAVARRLATGDFDRDGNADIAVASAGDSSLKVYFGTGSGTFDAPVSYAVAQAPYDVKAVDLDGDTYPDLVVTTAVNHQTTAGNAVVFLNDGAGSFSSASYTVGNYPRDIAVGDWNDDGHPDLAIANYRYVNSDAGSVTLLTNDGAGAFTASTILGGLNLKIFGVAAGDFDGDGIDDLAVTDDRNARLGVLLNEGAGAFSNPPVWTNVIAKPRSVQSGDINGDDDLDLVISFEDNDSVSYLLGDGSGAFASVESLDFNNSDGWALLLADINDDGQLDVAVGGDEGVSYRAIRSGAFQALVSMDPDNRVFEGLGAADFNSDGLTDLIGSAQDGRIVLFMGQSALPLAEVAGIPGLREAYFRGRGPNQEEDYYVFSANEGDVLTLAATSLVANSNYSHTVYLYDGVGAQLAVTYIYNGSGEMYYPALPNAGRYFVRVVPYANRAEEYRVRVSLMPPGTPLEDSSNDSVGVSDPLSFSPGAGGLVARIFANFDQRDTVDYFRIGNLGAGATVTVQLQQPADSPFVPVLKLFGQTGSVTKLQGAPGATSISYTFVEGEENLYHVMVDDDGSGGHLFSRYLLTVTLSDAEAPSITGVTLADEGETDNGLFVRFDLTFSEDLEAATVNDPNSYDLRTAGPDTLFGTADDEVYHFRSPGYTTGRTASLPIVDGPLQAGHYRLTVAAENLRDLFGNSLAEDFVRTFHIEGVQDTVTESRSNNTFAEADPLAEGTGSSVDGSFELSSSVAVGVDTVDLVLLDADGDGDLDLVGALTTGTTPLRLWLNDGTGTFSGGTPIVTYGTAQTPRRLLAAELTGDSLTDIAVTLDGSDSVRVYANNGDGTFTETANLSGAGDPHAIAAADLDGDTFLDLVVQMSTNPARVGVWLNDGAGAFTGGIVQGFASNTTLAGIALGDVDGDGHADLITSDTYHDNLLIRLGDGTGAFAPATTYGLTDTSPTHVALGDFNSDGALDVIVAFSSENHFDYFAGAGDGTFTRREIPLGAIESPNRITVADIDGDGVSDLLFHGYRSGGIYLFYGLNYGDSPLTGVVRYTQPSRTEAGAVGDLDGDGYREIVAANQATDGFDILTGRRSLGLKSDTEVLGLRYALARGTLRTGTTETDADYWKFSALAGDRLFVSTEHSINAWTNYSTVTIYDGGGASLSTFNGDSPGGEGQNNPLTIGAPGTIFVRFSPGTSTGEYSYVVNLLPAPIQTEPEDNDTVATATVPAFEITAGEKSASVFGNVERDADQDHYLLGNLAPGTQIKVTLRLPVYSLLEPIMTLFRDGEPALATTTQGETFISATVPADQGGAYYLRITAGGNTGSYRSTYLAEMELLDNAAPEILGATLPAGSSDGFISSFSVSLSEDLDPVVVNDLGSYELRYAGADDTLDTADDEQIAFTVGAYTAGSVINFGIVDEPLRPGVYRFTASNALVDLYGNPLPTPYTQVFTVSQLNGFTTEAPNNNSVATASAFVLHPGEDGYRSGGLRGRLSTITQFDYWKVAATAGQKMIVDIDVVGSSTGSELDLTVRGPNNAVMTALVSPDNGSFATTGPITITETGTHIIQLDRYDSFAGEYRVRVTLIDAGKQHETEANNTVGAANPLTLTSNGTSRGGNIWGRVHDNGDLDYFSLGTLASGETIFLTANTPTTSGLVPSVAVYTSSGSFVSEVSGGRSGDAVAQVDITTPGDYFALVRQSSQTGGLMAEYYLNVEIAPSDTTPYANLQVQTVTPPSGGSIRSGDTVNFSFTVRNLGNSDAATPPWRDRVVVSQNAIFGDGDDLELAAFDRAVGLTAGASYTVSESAELPEGIDGDFFLIVKTDVTDTVDEFVFEGDNVTASASTFRVTRAAYPDLAVQNLAVAISGPNADPEVTWTTANVGTGGAVGGLTETLQLFNRDTGNLVRQQTLNLNQDLASGGTAPRAFTLPNPGHGHYRVYVTTDAEDDFYEFGATTHAEAEDNTFSTDFTVYDFYQVSVAAQPAAGGSVTGGGTFQEGSSVTVTATPDTSTAPYSFSRWTRVTGELLSTRASYTFVPTRDESLIAHFALPTYTVMLTKSLAEGGTVTGGGSYSHGANVTLTASPKPGYNFVGWQENGGSLGNSSSLALVITGARSIVALFEEKNPSHNVTVATQPAGILSLPGSGTYTNGQTLNLSAPATHVDGATEYLFQQWTLNGVNYSSSRTASDTFTTLDPVAMAFTAVYSSRNFLPTVTSATPSIPTAQFVTEGAEFRVTLVFDRAMNPSIQPTVAIASANAANVPTFPTGGTWTANNTWLSKILTFGAGATGDYTLTVSDATDTDGRTMNAAQVLTFKVDVDAPAAPTLALGATSAATAQVTWNGYSAPADLQGFRLFLDTSDFATVDPADAINSVGAGVRSHVFTNLELDTPYFAAVVAVDNAGNFEPAVTTLSFTLASDIPPPVAVTPRDYTPSGFTLDWAGYDPSTLKGFAGYHVYRAQADFSDVSAMTPVATLDAAATSYTVTGLDRTQDYYFAVVGFNQLDQQNPAVTTVAWSDPLSGAITEDRTFGGNGATVEVLQPVTVSNGATLAIEPGTTLYFAPGAGITIADGILDAQGTALQPIVLTSANDRQGSPTAAQRGDWGGVTLQDATNVSRLDYVWIAYGEGLTLTGATPNLGPLALVRNSGAGLTVANGTSLTASDLYLAFNDVGLAVGAGSVVDLSNSVLKNNTSFAATNSGGTLTAQGNWWGTSDAGAIAGSVQGTIDTSSPLLEEPLLGTGFGLKNGITQTTNGTVTLVIASFNASAYRVSEDSTFAGVLYEDVFGPTAVNPYTPQPWEQAFTVSTGAGLKTIHLELLSPTGGETADASVSLDLLGDGPTIQGFSLQEGDLITRPVIVSATTTAPLGVASVRFLVNGAPVAEVAGSALSQRWDISGYVSGVYRVRVEARDMEGNLAVRELNVTINPLPAGIPIITTPTEGTTVTVDTIDVSGTAEPSVAVRILRNGAVVATGNANVDGDFSFTAIPLVEGANTLVAVAFDAAGTGASQPVQVISDTMGPVGLEIEQPLYDAKTGLLIQWRYTGEEGERPTRYEVFWDTVPFDDVDDAAFSSGILQEMSFALKNRPDLHYYIRVVGYDAAGNASVPTAMVEATLDETAPVIQIFYDEAMPAGPGDLGVILQANEPLQGTPTLTILPKDMRSPISVPLTANSSQSFSGTFPVTDASARSGIANVTVSARDLNGNRFTGAPTGETLVFDVTRPTGELRLNREAPIQTLTTQSVQLTLELSEEAAAGTAPELLFSPPSGADVEVELVNSGDNRIFTGQLTLFPSMGRGVGLFLMQVEDANGNTGTVLTQGEELELYNTQLPPPPAAPAYFAADTLPGGQIRLVWAPSELASTYALYRVPSSQSGIPNVLIAQGIAATEYVDLPPTDGTYRYVVTASRLGAESAPSITVTGLSDRVAPAAPLNLQATLGYTGVQLTFDNSSGEPNPHHWVLYRNGTPVGSHSPILRVIRDTPPRGEMVYQVAASDAYGNHALSNSATIEMYVGAVRNLAANVSPQGAVALSWTNTDNQATGYKVYRNGVQQTPTPITGASYADPIALPANSPVTYAVTAVNDQDQESIAREIVVQPLKLALKVNPNASGVEQASVVGFFDLYRVAFNHASDNADLNFSEIRVRRDVGGNVLLETYPVSQAVTAGATAELDVPVPAPGASVSNQLITLHLKTQPAEDGSYLRYQLDRTFTEGIARPQNAIMLTPQGRPLAGGLSNFDVKLTNLGHAPAQFVLVRDNGSLPGDLEISVRTDSGQEVSVTEFRQLVPGMTFNSSGDGMVVLNPGQSRTFTFEDVFVPAVLAESTKARFTAKIDPIYYGLRSPGERTSGPVSGSTEATPRETPYYGTASTARAIYSNDELITVTGQALNRDDDTPLPNTALRLGFNVQGFVFHEDVTTDGSGNYSFDYQPPFGIAGRIAIWAAHPEVVDELDQASVTLYRSFIAPARGDIRMSKSDTLDFEVSLINPGDVPLENVTMDVRAYVVNPDTSETDITSVDAILREPLPVSIGAGARAPVKLQLQSTLDAPDNAVVEIKLTSDQGAASTFTGFVSLLPAIPILSVEAPQMGYVDLTVDRGSLKSRQVTIVNNGLRPLENPVLTPPQNISWMHINLPLNAQGKAELEDIPVGGKLTFTVVYTPPEDVEIGYHDDVVTISGSNAVSDFELGLYAQISSNLTGSVLFSLDNTLVQPLPNATVRLRNLALGINRGPYKTDAAGQVLVDDLQEGQWSWQASAPAHSTAAGTVEVIPDQTVQVAQRLYKSLVTVKFSVVPKPFTDRYEIKIEQTFETRVPAPVLYLDPPQYSFENPPDGFETTVIFTLHNEGLIRAFDVEISGMELDWGSVEPLISYLPEIAPQTSIDLPFRFKIFDPAEASPARAAMRAGAIRAGGASDFASCFLGIPMGADADLARGMAALVKASYQCSDGAAAKAALSGMLLASSILSAPVHVNHAPWAYLARAIGCATNFFATAGGGGGGGGGPSGASGGHVTTTTGSGCFLPDTPVLMASGASLPIEQISIGDRVATGRATNATVVDVVTLQKDDVYAITYEDAQGRPAGQLFATAEHNIWVDGKEWVPVAGLQLGDWLHRADGSQVRIASIQPVSGEHTVYTLLLGEDSAFYANGILVQDSCGNYSQLTQDALPEGGQAE
ncbi:MAG: FG-GAP-like repeat-containing protein [Verrucomicrobiota bacterium JB022]|nr:FG-GAP-like repeat-containing protein [Verrucomicrobiota bacterium JB022]